MNNCGPDVLQEVEEENEFKFAGQYLKKVQYSFYLMADTNLQNNFKKVFTNLWLIQTCKITLRRSSLP